MSTPLQVVRARITPAEYHALKILAITQRRDVADLAADALRRTYPSIERTDDGDTRK